MPDSRAAAHLTADLGFELQPGHMTFGEINHEIFSYAILALPLVQEGL